MIKESDQCRRDPVAHAEFIRLRKLYKGVAQVGPLDEGIINRYCLEVSDLVWQRKHLREMVIEFRTEAMTPGSRQKLYDLILATRQMIYKSKLHLFALEDRLLLNPKSRVKVPKADPPEEDLSPMGLLLRRADERNAQRRREQKGS